MTPVLHGYRPSVYLRIARMTAAAKGVACDHVEIDPFTPPVPPAYLALHPFGRVPALVHGDFVLYETVAITRYLDEAFPGPALQPDLPQARARMTQVQSVVDSYAYWPLVRQVYSHAVFRPRHGQDGDAEVLATGLGAAPRVLAALEALAAEGPWLLGPDLTLADLHLAPILAAFAEADEAGPLLREAPRLARWLDRIRVHPAFRATAPG